jgi:hypothetical protein
MGVVVYILNKQLQTANKVSAVLGVGEGLTTSHHEKTSM